MVVLPNGESNNGIATSRCRCWLMRCWVRFGGKPTRGTAKMGRADKDVATTQRVSHISPPVMAAIVFRQGSAVRSPPESCTLFLLSSRIRFALPPGRSELMPVPVACVSKLSPHFEIPAWRPNPIRAKSPSLKVCPGSAEPNPMSP